MNKTSATAKTALAAKTEGYLTWTDEKGRCEALAKAGQALVRASGSNRAKASDVYLNVGPASLSVRDTFTRGDYESFRRDEARPRRPKDKIRACMEAYEEHGIVRNVVDLMSDFASQGLDLVHPNERVQKFYKEWFRRVEGPERSERFLNVLYRTAAVVVKRQTAILTKSDQTRIRRSTAAPETKVAAPPELRKYEVPWRYSFLNPLSIEVVAEELAPFVGPEGFVYGVRLPDSVFASIKAPKGPAMKAAVARLPIEIRDAVNRGERIMPLDPNKIRVHHYKRDDWRAWATPMLAPVLKDLAMLEKMKLADLAALDGAISSIRVWKLGSLEHKIMPSEAVINRLAEVLVNGVPGGIMDLIWGPDIELKETSTDVYRFLGEAKYAPVLAAVFQGLGIPPTLSGTATPGGFTNNSVSLRTLIERLEYGRSVLRTFWEYEVRLVQQAMGFRFPPQIVFDRLLTDEAAEKQLFINLADRDLISIESLQERFGLVPEIEQLRIRREKRRREGGKLPVKAGPFHDANHGAAMQKIFAQSGAYAPSEMGVETQPKKPGQKTPADVKAAGVAAKQEAKGKGQPGQGRPKNSKDGSKRKSRTPKPRTSANVIATAAWAERAQETISELAQPAYLHSVGKKNMRQLSDGQERAFHAFAFGVLCSLEPDSEVGTEQLKLALGKKLGVPVAVNELVGRSLSLLEKKGGRKASAEELRRLRAGAYAMWKVSDEGGDADNSLPALPRAECEPAQTA